MKLAAIGILHETNTFSSVPTDDYAFEHATMGGRHGDLLGQEVWDVYGNAEITVAGYKDADALPGIDVVPIGYAATGPFGTWPRATFDRIAGAQIAKLEAEGPFDGVLMWQHGACVVEGYPDGDAEMIRRVREVVGPRVPIGNVMDTHGNVSPAQVHGVDITLLWRTNPHLDCRARGFQLAQLIAKTVRGEIEPVQAIVNPPMLANILAQNTGDEPMKGLLAQALEITAATPGVLDMSIGEGFPYSDVPHMGMAIVAIADRDQGAAQRAAEDLARRTWEQRLAFDPRGVSVADAVRLQRAPDAKGPIQLLDVGDNMGAGTPGDSTFILEALQREGRRNWLLTVVDPEAVAASVAAGVGAHVDLMVGGKVDAHHGKPQRITGTVRLITAGPYRAHDEKVHAGHQIFDGGVRVVIETDGGGTIQLCQLPVMTMSVDQHYSAGTDPRRYDLVVTKGVHSPQPAYNPISSRIVYVDTPGISTADARFLGHKHRRRPMFPFEPDTSWP